MTEILNFFQNHYSDLLAIIGSIVSIATIIVKLTKTTSDDTILAKVVEVLAFFSIVNTKSDQEKIDNA